MKETIYLSKPGVLSILGEDIVQHISALLSFANPALPSSTDWVLDKKIPIGEIEATLPLLPAGTPSIYDSRNNRLLWHALRQVNQDIIDALNRFGEERVAVVMGTSTGGVEENLPFFQQLSGIKNEDGAKFNQEHQLLSSPADFVAHHYGLNGFCYSVSSACTSGARALISAARLLQADLCDAVICGGVDSLSLLTINGFHSLEVLSEDIAQPFSTHRKGINIGEAAAVFVLTKENIFDEQIALLGYGASSDAWHMSTPRPDALGAVMAIEHALNRACLEREEITWVNLHGTGTQHNDAMECIAIEQCLGACVACTSTKPFTGHTLGAAGALEAAIVWGFISHKANPQGLLPAQYGIELSDEYIKTIALSTRQSMWPSKRRVALSNSFAFGGNNTALILGECTC